MVFENLTLFEIQLDGAQFGPRSMAADETDIDETDGSNAGRRVLPLFVLAFAMAGIAMLWRRSRAMDTEIESDEAEADLAAAQ